MPNEATKPHPAATEPSRLNKQAAERPHTNPIAARFSRPRRRPRPISATDPASASKPTLRSRKAGTKS